MDIDWFETAGKGVIHSYVVVTQPIVGAFIGAVPYVVAVIELDDCKEEDGTVTRVAGVMMEDESRSRDRATRIGGFRGDRRSENRDAAMAHQRNLAEHLEIQRIAPFLKPSPDGRATVLGVKQDASSARPSKGV